MSKYSLVHLDDHDLIRELNAFVGHERGATAELLARIAEVDARRLYLPASYPSMYAYCVHALHLSEDEAYKRIRVARTARRFPMIFTAIADGRLSLTAIVVLTPYLTEQTADGLLSAATHKSKSDIEQLLAERYPQPELMGLVEAIPESRADSELVPEPVETHSCARTDVKLVPEPVAPPAILQPLVARAIDATAATAPRSQITAQARGRFAIHATVGTQAHDDLRRAQELLGHKLPASDVGEVLSRALRLLVVDLEKRKLAATPRPQRKHRATKSARHIPAHVKRAVHERDGDRCTFVAENGRRCESRTRLEFDHIEEVARGGRATEANIRLRCRAHNQYTAECAFGRGFMEGKRGEARRAAGDARGWRSGCS